MLRRAMAVGAAAALAMTAVVSSAGTAGAGTGHAELREVMRRLTTEDGAPGALAEVRDRRGRTAIASGVADVRTGAPMDPRSRFRIGSLTKPFVATVVLQLVGEGRVVLDEPIERHLPGVVRGNGNDGREITVRHLLQHTSGLPDVLDHRTPQEFLRDPLRHWEPRELVDIALQHPRLFEPGRRWDYSNTNYLLAGMLVESVTGRPYGEEIERRIIEPLGLHGTSVPGDDPGIPAPHPRGYVRTPDGLLDLTHLNPTLAGSSGGMISSAADLNRFFGALLHGRLLRPAQRRQMMTAMPTGGSSGARYGLGLQWRPLPCSDDGFWGHGGDMLGFTALAGATTSGRRASVMANLNPGGTQAQKDDLTKALTTALC
ncbi:serine hydrolase domain-containing protein [Thermomonospora cellulosilytica]|uniref:D-alanyl-D-alanine carboxypeptidase n=1 Tax=Thermomonospora cellulosilytica TaxID=1411118 RepID=A0A7W3MV36_9ACTN|nr:serine hydrolase domain-containing protein [Thermomonospora cellulosilytica]MBA9002435.1 D-alanyl-D-alanine carboxypeptidase [Thermomonospora cellulosilytica]